MKAKLFQVQQTHKALLASRKRTVSVPKGTSDRTKKRALDQVLDERSAHPGMRGFVLDHLLFDPVALTESKQLQRLKTDIQRKACFLMLKALL